MNEQFVASVIGSANGFRLEKRGESIRHTVFTQSCHTLACRLIRIEGKSYHLRETEVRIFPFFLRLILGKVISIPFLLLANDVGKLIEGNQVLLSIKLITHQNAIRRTRKVDGYIDVKFLGAFQDILNGVFFFLGELLTLACAENCTVFLGSCAEVCFINEKEVNLAAENLGVLVLDILALKILQG